MIHDYSKRSESPFPTEAKQGQGTTFTIYLPRYVGQVEARTEGVAEQAMRGQETILLVEDEPAILRMATRMLEGLGYTVLAANTTGEAFRQAKEHSGEIHLLITDVVMPEMNGRELAEKMLSLYPHLKRLFMSGYTADVIAHHSVLDEGVLHPEAVLKECPGPQAVGSAGRPVNRERKAALFQGKILAPTKMKYLLRLNKTIQHFGLPIDAGEMGE